MESQCLIDTTNFIQTKNHFIHFLSIFAFFWYIVMYIFFPQIYFGITQLEKWFFFNWILCVMVYHIMQNFLEKYAPKLPWLKFKHEHLWKIVQCDNIFGPPIVCFTLGGSFDCIFTHETICSCKTLIDY
jgi:hypothetical protein